MEDKEDESHEEGAEESSTEKADGAAEEHDRIGDKEMKKDTEDVEKGPDEAEKSKDGETEEGETKPSVSAESDKPASPKKSVPEDKEAEAKKDVGSNPSSQGGGARMMVRLRLTPAKGTTKSSLGKERGLAVAVAKEEANWHPIHRIGRDGKHKIQMLELVD